MVCSPRNPARKADRRFETAAGFAHDHGHTMTVPEPLRDDLFGATDAELASAYSDLEADDLAAEAMPVYVCSIDDARERVETDPQRVRADIVRYWT